MRRLSRAVAAVSTAVVAAGLLTACGADEEKAAPKLPERVCWGGALTGGDVAPLLPAGDKIEFQSRSGLPFALTEDRKSQTCSLDVDGRTRFQVTADLRKFEDSIDWRSMESAEPKPLDAGKKGIIWNDGAASYFVCEPAKDAGAPGRYIDLGIHLSDPPDEAKVRAALPKLMKELVAFAQRELKCPAGAAS
ncbi:hypothetical protein [Streptomyces termitum]|uniref:hypothetical protein n=1 Tax=Streptomyces termitum TaxID=67368 RepID=UPI0037A4C33E